VRRRPAQIRIRNKSTTKLRKYLAILGIVSIAAIIAFALPKVFIISKINCQSQYGPCGNQINDSLKNVEGNNYFSANRQLIELLSKNASVRTYQLRFSPLHTLNISIVERKPVFSINRNRTEGEYYLVDEDGVVISRQESSSIPVLILEDDNGINIGDTLQSQIIFAAKIQSDMDRIYTTRIGLIHNDALETSLPNGITVIFPTVGEKDILLGALELILSRLNSRTQDSRIGSSQFIMPKIIDLRFKNPVLKY
jgi:cell division septal protein FtsQ